MGRKDPVTTALRLEVLRRDGGCMAAHLGAPDGCRGRSGYPLPATEWWQLELDHVKGQPMMGKRAPSDTAHLVALCTHHHQDGWATRNRPLLRAYLRAVAQGAESRDAAYAVLTEWRAEVGVHLGQVFT